MENFFQFAGELEKVLDHIILILPFLLLLGTF